MHSSFSPDEALLVCSELDLARQNGLILADDLHMYTIDAFAFVVRSFRCYLVTPMFQLPYDLQDWKRYFILISSLPDIV